MIFDEHAALGHHLDRSGLSAGLCLIITDDNVAPLYLEGIQSVLEDESWQPYPISIPPGEASKSTEELGRLYDFCIDRGVDRATPIIALGGGVVGDLAGFCAATILRGVPFVQVPTTLVAQIDSSIGGKTGINHSRGKNLIGSFYQPKLVLSDIKCLKSLPQREWVAGLAELVKHALIDSRDHVDICLENWDALTKRDTRTLQHLIPISANVKTTIVSQDTHERGIRAHLNFGHTVGHALEKVTGYGKLLHGEAVALGMAVALRISEKRRPNHNFQPAWNLLGRLPLQNRPDVDFGRLEQAMSADKKNLRGRRRFVLLSEPGSAVVADDVRSEEIEEAWYHLDAVRRNA